MASLRHQPRTAACHAVVCGLRGVPWRCPAVDRRAAPQMRPITRRSQSRLPDERAGLARQLMEALRPHLSNHAPSYPRGVGMGELPWQEMAQVAAVTLIGSSMAGVAQFVAETFVFLLLRILEGPGIVRRFNPSAKMQTSFTSRNFAAASVSHIPLFLLIGVRRHEIMAKASWGVPSPWDVWLLALALMLLHDAWFFWTHTFLHRHKAAYRALHAQHHRYTNELGPFATSDADPMEFLIDWAGFYVAAVPLALHWWPAWSPIAVGLALIPCGLVNVLGHCGYEIPCWLGGLLSFGVLLLPGAQSPATHFIHHVDPRFNRSLYFVWWDRMLGTFSDCHPIVSASRKGDCSFFRKCVEQGCVILAPVERQKRAPPYQ